MPVHSGSGDHGDGENDSSVSQSLSISVKGSMESSSGQRPHSAHGDGSTGSQSCFRSTCWGHIRSTLGYGSRRVLATPLGVLAMELALTYHTVSGLLWLAWCCMGPLKRGYWDEVLSTHGWGTGGIAV